MNNTRHDFLLCKCGSFERLRSWVVDRLIAQTTAAHNMTQGLGDISIFRAVHKGS